MSKAVEEERGARVESAGLRDPSGGSSRSLPWARAPSSGSRQPFARAASLRSQSHRTAAASRSEAASASSISSPISIDEEKGEGGGAMSGMSSAAGLTSAHHWRVVELLEVTGGDVLIHFVDWPSKWDQRVETRSGRLQPLRSFSRGYTGPPSLANKLHVKDSFEQCVIAQQAQQRAKVTHALETHSAQRPAVAAAAAGQRKARVGTKRRSSLSAHLPRSFGGSSAHAEDVQYQCQPEQDGNQKRQLPWSEALDVASVGAVDRRPLALLLTSFVAPSAALDACLLSAAEEIQSEGGSISSVSVAGRSPSTATKPASAGWELENGKWVRRDRSDSAAASSGGRNEATSSSIPHHASRGYVPPHMRSTAPFKAGGCLGSGSMQSASAVALRLPPCTWRHDEDFAPRYDSPTSTAQRTSNPCKALQEMLEVRENSDSSSGSSNSEGSDGNHDGSDSDADSHGDNVSGDSELQQLHSACADSSLSDVEEPAASDAEKGSAEEESDAQGEDSSAEEEDEEEEDDDDRAEEDQEDTSSEEEGDEEEDAEEEEEEEEEASDVDEPLTFVSNKPSAPAFPSLPQLLGHMPQLKVEVAVPTDHAAVLSGLYRTASQLDKMAADRIKILSQGPSVPAASSKAAAEATAAAAAASAPTFAPLPISLATMARQARKIVATLPTPVRVAVMGAQGSGRSSLINLLCSATNPTPNDPHLSTRAHVQRSSSAVTTRIKAHAINVQVALVDSGCFAPPALAAYLEGKLSDGCRPAEAHSHFRTAAPSAARAISGALLVWSVQLGARQQAEMSRLLRVVNERGIPFVLVVTHADSAMPLAELAAPSSFRPLYEHRVMQPLIQDIAKRTGVNANQIYPVANYSTQRRRQYTLERNAVLALGQLAKQIRDELKFGQRTVSCPVAAPSLSKPFPSASGGAAAALQASQSAQVHIGNPQAATPSPSLQPEAADSKADIQDHLAEESSSCLSIQEQGEPLDAEDQTAAPAASSRLSLQLHMRAASDGEERKETAPRLDSSDAAPQRESKDEAEDESDRPPTAHAAGSGSTPLSSPRSVQSDGSDASWHHFDSPSPKHE